MGLRRTRPTARSTESERAAQLLVNAAVTALDLLAFGPMCSAL